MDLIALKEKAIVAGNSPNLQDLSSVESQDLFIRISDSFNHLVENCKDLKELEYLRLYLKVINRKYGHDKT